ncbi:S41 family peptidase [Ichthyenterobacterium sp. W332]|uniref:S41 family peptidase n=1 Tax=Microcosmobacter mediterraneus TaxID=3075607 RepID=A0ABU2YHN7_9FLAO|nr:S41 family peptidase [Ichthyenterobacterium sp. W332]MDT0557677.1 S41 family peptidase [Ichthyenterobacterium sp. W332]
MKHYKSLLLLFSCALILNSCFEDQDDNIQFSNLEVQDFVWKGMNIFYLYKEEISDLADDRFGSDQAYTEYLQSFDSPESLFESLLFQPNIIDRFSLITSDYIALQQALTGTSLSSGIRFFGFENPSNPSEFILVTYLVAKNSPAETSGIQRGDFFNQIDGISLTADNVNTLLASDSFTLHYADYLDNGTPEISDDDFESNGNTVAITKSLFTENPVNTSSIIDVDGENVGYLLYRGFRADFVDELNSAFGDFAANNVQHLVLDLRYNGGGRVDVAQALGSMITGQFTGDTFSKLVYNETLQNNNATFPFVNDFNSIALDKVYVLTTEQTASASELIINSLRPYIEVVQIGTNTAGKTQASITIYDSPEFTNTTNVNPNHTYAMQPLVANSINVNDDAVPNSGITPNIPLSESVYSLGTFGDVNEPLLAAAIADIQGLGRIGNSNIDFEYVKTILGQQPFEKELFIEQSTVQLNK